MSINKVILIGNLGKDAESRQAGKGFVSHFSVACTEKYKDKGGETSEATEWFNVELWNNEGLSKYLAKGQMVYVEGSLRNKKWTDGKGDEHHDIVVQAFNVQLLGKKNEGNGAGRQQQRPQFQPAVMPESRHETSQDEGEDLPF